MRKIPDKHRWDVWVTIAWIVAILICGFSICMVVAFGTFYIPGSSLSNGYGMQNSTQINWVIWAAGIGQSIGALLVAAMFSIINGTYRLSCENTELLHKLIPKEIAPQNDGATPKKITPGLRVTFVNENSPLKQHLHPGCIITSLNGKEPESLKGLRDLLVDGENELSFTSLRGEAHTVKFHTSNRQIGLKAERP